MFLGCRLPIVQGGTFTFIVPTLSLLSVGKMSCPEGWDSAEFANDNNHNDTFFQEMWQVPTYNSTYQGVEEEGVTKTESDP